MFKHVKPAFVCLAFSLSWAARAQALPTKVEPRVRITLDAVQDNFSIQIKNTQMHPLRTVRVECDFNGVKSRTDYSKTIESHKTSRLKIPFSKPGLPGSYTTRITLYFHGPKNGVERAHKTRIFDFGRKAHLKLPLVVESTYVLKKGTIFVRGMKPAKLKKLRFHFPYGITISNRELVGNKVRLDVEQPVVPYKASIPLVITYDTAGTVNGKEVHFAGEKTVSVNSGEYFHYLPETIVQLVVTGVLVFLILLVTVLIRRKRREKESRQAVLFGGIVLAVAVLLIFTAYSLPARRTLDEHYHVTASEKYLQGMYFMHPHPPLSKLVIALGEFLVNPNQDVPKSAFLKTDALAKFPIGYSYLGIRLFPVLFAILSAFLFYLLLYEISKKSWFAFLFSFFYLLDNALIVHYRFALSESTQIFFILLSVLYFARSFNRSAFGPKQFFTLGIFIGLAVSVKITGFIACILFVVLLVRQFSISGDKIKDFLLKKLPVRASTAVLGVALPIIMVWYIHTGLGRNVMHGFHYDGSKTLINAIKKGQSWNPLTLPVSIRDNVKHIVVFHTRIRPLRHRKSETGSHPIGWPIGIKPMRFKKSTLASKGKARYIYLLANPLLWLIALCSVLAGIWVGIQGFFLNKEKRGSKYFLYIVVFTSLYLSYMVAMMSIRRVLYLYHYFIPLIFAYVLSFCLFSFYYEGAEQKARKRLDKVLVAFILCAFALFVFFSPFTYNIPISESGFAARNWFSFWGLRP